MSTPIRAPKSVQEKFCCPVCNASLKHFADKLICQNDTCFSEFPIVDGIPVMINDKNSVFSIDDYVSHRETYFLNNKGSAIKKFLYRLIPAISKNIKGKENYGKFTESLLKQSDTARVLVLGGGNLGMGMDCLLNNTSIELVDTDVAFGERTMLICDAHNIPFQDQSFDGVVIQAVLEHVVDPYQCCEEIFRVLKKDGMVYAETPFMQ